MSSRHISFEVLLPESAGADVLREFMTRCYLPAVRVSPTRTGQVTGLTVWRRLDDAPQAAGDFRPRRQRRGRATANRGRSGHYSSLRRLRCH